MNCKICNRELNIEGDEGSIDCGGDCLVCIKMWEENKTEEEVLKELNNPSS